MTTVKAGPVEMPALGFGTWPLKGEEAARMVAAAIEAGFRAIDTAEMYGNEEAVGEGIRASGVAREHLFVTTKVWHDHLRDGEVQRAAEASVRRLDVGPVDLYLVHWPNPDVPVAETMGALNQVLEHGLARAIGVSNFPVALLEEAVAASAAPLAANQVEYHPLVDQRPVKAFLDAHGMALIAYSPLAKGKLVEVPAIAEIAKAHGRTVAQIALRWLIQQDGVAAIPKTSTPERLAENLAALDFELSQDDMALLSSMHTPEGRMLRPAWAPVFDT